MKRIAHKRTMGIAAMILLAACLCLGVIILKHRAFGYGYNPRQDYQYRFSSEHVSQWTVSLTNGRILLPGNLADYSTAFLELNVHYTLKGLFEQPEVLMTGGNDTLRQTLECRVKGIRYLNISQLLKPTAKEIRLTFDGCRCRNASVRLIAYKNLDPSKERLLILSPHPDDAEIAAYGLYAANAPDCFIATITAGDAGSMRYDELFSDSIRQYLEKGKIRVWNSLTVPQLAGIPAEQAINLGYFDASLSTMHDDTLVLGSSRYLHTTDIRLFRSSNCHHLPASMTPASSWRSLVNDLGWLLRTIQPTIIVSTYPAIDYHKDHKYTTVALLQAMKEFQYDNCQLWLYTNHYPLTKMYPDGPTGSQISLPPRFGKKPIYFDQLESFPLSPLLQAQKTLALDAMNDLRPDTQYRTVCAPCYGC